MSTSNRSHEIKAGLLILLGIVIFLTFVFSITGVTLQPERKKIQAQFGHSNGIRPGSLVRLGGVLVGEVERVAFNPGGDGRIDVAMSVKKNAPIKTDSEAHITSLGMMGDFYIEITPGSAEAAMLADGGVLLSRDVPSLNQLGVAMAEPFQTTMAQMESLLVRLNVMLDEKNTMHFSNIVAGIDTVLQENRNSAKEIAENIAGLSSKMTTTVERVDRIMEGNAETLSETLTRSSSMIHSADSLMVEFAKVSDKLNYLMYTNEVVLKEVLENVQDASANFEVFSKQIKEQPWSLVRRSQPPVRKVSKK